MRTLSLSWRNGMILNDRQYRIASSQLRKLQALIDTGVKDKSIPDWVQEAQSSGIKSQIDDIKMQIKEYELLKSGKKTFAAVSDIQHLGLTLIQARILKGLTQGDLADKLGMSEQQIQRYEASEYKGANLSRLTEIANVLNIRIKEYWSTETETEGNTVFLWQDSKSIDWSKFPLKEMIKRNWIQLHHGENPISAIRQYFLDTAGEQYATALHRKKYHGMHRPDEYSLLAWQARVIEKAKIELSSNQVPEFEFRDDWIKELSHISSQNNAPIKAKEYLLSHGIIMVIEPHLTGTYLDGAAMQLESGNPIIALTLRFDRLDHFWFVLFHELAHIYLHLMSNIAMDFFDEKDDGIDDSIEREADKYALNSLIPEKEWKKCLSRFTLSKTAVLQDAKRLGIDPSIISGRIRKERNNYSILNDLIGLNTVRKQFGAFNDSI